MSWYECPRCGRELRSDSRCKRCGVRSVPVSGECPVNLNTGTALELRRIAGFGKRAAENIVLVRKIGRKYERVEDILKISAVGRKTYEKVKDRVVV